MKVAQEVNDVEKFGVTKNIKCGMTINSYAFKLLAEQYSDPIKAIVQEISANCLDAHSRAGKSDVPFKVKLPNKLDNHIRFRDYGVSMSPEVIENVYANYMTSDKRNTNDEVGYFGIGSKTPLAYADSFNVTTYKDGIMRMYTIGYDENNIPEINQYGEYPTDEPDGVEVSFAVKDNDFKDFREAAEFVYSFYDVHPIVNGDENFCKKSYNVIIEGTNWKLVKYAAIASRSAYVVMGHIGYEVDPYQFNDMEIRNILRSNIHIEVPVGSVKVTPSRESLMYNESTIKYLTDYIKSNVNKELHSELVSKLDKCDSLWSARKLFVAVNRQVDINTNILKTLNSSCKYDINTIVLGSKKINSNQLSKGFDYFQARNRTYRNSRVFDTFMIGTENIYVLANEDENKYYDKKCRQLSKDTNKTVSLIFCKTSKEEIMEFLGCTNQDNAVYLLSEIPNPPKQVRYASVRKTTNKYIKTIDCLIDGSVEKSMTIDIRNDDTIVYVVKCRNKLVSDYGSELYFSYMIRLIKGLNINIPTIAVFNSQVKDSLLKNKHSKINFISFSEWCKNFLKNLSNDYSDDIERVNTLKALKHLDIYSYLNDKLKHNKLSDEHTLNKVLDYVKVDNLEESEVNLNAIIELSNYINIDEKQCDKLLKVNQDIIDLENKIIEDYPLLNFIFNRGRYYVEDISVDHIVNNILAVDSFNKGN